MNKMRSSTKIAIGFVAIVAIGWFGFNKITDAMIMGEKFTPILPGKVNIVGVNPGAGYKIIVSNELAQLVETQGGFGANESEDTASEGAVKKRIPIRELLQSLQGDPKALGAFVMIMNDLSENNLPPVRVLWKKDDLEKAFHGDANLRQKLESDLNIKLDGTPLPRLNLASLENQIVVEVPVTVNVNLRGVPTPVTGQVLQYFQTRLAKAVQADYALDSNPTATVKAGYYAQEARKILGQPKSRENVQTELEDKVSTSAQQSLVEIPKRILDSAFIVVNDQSISQITYHKVATDDGKPLFNLTIDLNDEGRRRLWQFSRNRVGDQLLLVSDGVAIAPPRILHPLSGGEITVTRMRDQTVLDDLVDTWKKATHGTATAGR